MSILLFSLTWLIPPTLYLMGLLGLRIGSWVRSAIKRNVWYPQPGDIIEARDRITHWMACKMGGEKNNFTAEASNDERLDLARPGDMYLVVSSDLEPALGPMLTRRKSGRISMMAMAGRRGFKTLEWNTSTPLCNEGFNPWFRRVQVQPNLRQDCEERAKRLLDEEEKDQEI